MMKHCGIEVSEDHRVFQGRWQTRPEYVKNLASRVIATEWPETSRKPLISVEQETEYNDGATLIYLDLLVDETHTVVGLIHVLPISDQESFVSVYMNNDSPIIEKVEAEIGQSVESAVYLLAQKMNQFFNDAGTTFSVGQSERPGPWDKIKNKTGWDSTALRLWWNGLKIDEISAEIGISSSRVSNRLTELRKEYGEDTVPKAIDPRRKRFRRKVGTK